MTTFDRLEAVVRDRRYAVTVRESGEGWVATRAIPGGFVLYPPAPTMEAAVLALLDREAA